jgi:epidermal growth factor receptor substrate 15
MFNKDDIKLLEVQELQAELLAVKQLVDLKDQNICKLKEDLRQSQVANNKAVGEHRFLQEEILTLQKEQERTLEDYEKVLDKVETLTNDRTEKFKFIEGLEDRNRLLQIQLAEARNMISQLELQLNDKNTKEHEEQYEIKVLANQLTLVHEQEDELLKENKELKAFNEELVEKLRGLNEEVSFFHEKSKEKDKMIEGFTNELRDYDDILGDFKGFKEVNRREKEEKERGILKIKELIVMNEEKERNLEKKDKEINELRITLNNKERTVADIMNILQEEKKNSDSKEKKIRELQDKIELLDFKQMEVKEYLARKAERMKARYEAELALVHSLKIQV